MRTTRKSTVKNIFIVLYLLFVTTTVYHVFPAQAQEVQTNQAGATTQGQSEQPEQPPQTTQVPLPEIPPTPRSKLEIIQYILLPFAIGASVWLILRLEKMELEETKEE